MTKTLSWGAAVAARPLSATVLHLAAATLRAASGTLDRHAAGLTLARAERAERAAQAAAAPHVVEFHALHREAGAPEGALYVNGRLVGVIEGVTRL